MAILALRTIRSIWQKKCDHFLVIAIAISSLIGFKVQAKAFIKQKPVAHKTIAKLINKPKSTQVATRTQRKYADAKSNINPIKSTINKSTSNNSSSVSIKTPKKQKENTSPWATSITTGMSHSMDYYSDYYATFGATLSYDTSDKTSYYFNMGYSTPVTNEFTVYEDDLDRYGLEDVTLGFSYSNFFMFNKTAGLSFDLGLAAPTSKASQAATQYAALYPSLTFVNKFNSYFKVRTDHVLTLAAHKYDTANEMGTSYNSPIGINNSITLSLMYKILSWNNKAGLYTYRQYNDITENVQTLSTSLGCNIWRTLSASAYYVWRDKIITNNSLFDEDRVTTGLNIQYVF